ncbi:MAG: sigma-54-dependent Fis family transcriptional regulator [Phycisphaerae bacterium]|nr:sigma-54-dependent Fis family transcriptional regulator [Phycisphaerae bacterium]
MGFITSSEVMRRLCRRAELFAGSDEPILLTGETGTGKTVLAEYIHACSPRAARPFGVRNCAALTPQLAVSELFGHSKGAFTGADAARVGAFRACDGGTLFLDEVSRLDMQIQGAVLKAIDEGKIQPLGSDHTEAADVRLIAASNQNLWNLCETGRFADDLFYRLAVLTLRVPPLRERIEDIPHLFRHFLGSSLAPGLACEATEDALARLCAYPFPGNVRELRSVAMRCSLLAMAKEGSEPDKAVVTIDPEIVSEALAVQCEFNPVAPLPDVGISDRTHQLRRQSLESALRRHGGNISAAASELGVSRQTASKWKRQYGLH